MRETGFYLGGVELEIRREQGHHGIGAGAVVIAGHRDGVGHAVGADPAINEDATGRDFDRNLDEPLAVGERDRGGFSGRAEHKDTEAMRGETLDHAGGGRFVELAGGSEGRGHGNHDAAVALEGGHVGTVRRLGGKWSRRRRA